MSNTRNVSGKALGCILGGAVGDAFASPYEGRPAPVSIGNGARWQISDDTQLTLATCEALIEKAGSVDPETVAARFAAWQRQRRITGVGASTHKALLELGAGRGEGRARRRQRRGDENRAAGILPRPG